MTLNLKRSRLECCLVKLVFYAGADQVFVSNHFKTELPGKLLPRGQATRNFRKLKKKILNTYTLTHSFYCLLQSKAFLKHISYDVYCSKWFVLHLSLFKIPKLMQRTLYNSFDYLNTGKSNWVFFCFFYLCHVKPWDTKTFLTQPRVFSWDTHRLELSFGECGETNT